MSEPEAYARDFFQTLAYPSGSEFASGTTQETSYPFPFAFGSLKMLSPLLFEATRMEHPAGGDEILPYVLYKADGAQAECALWQFKDGPKALALFLSGDAATTYRDAANLGAEWKIFCPPRAALLQLLLSCRDGGVGLAVLDPDLEKAKRIFSIDEILRVAAS